MQLPKHIRVQKNRRRGGREATVSKTTQTAVKDDFSVVDREHSKQTTIAMLRIMETNLALLSAGKSFLEQSIWIPEYPRTVSCHAATEYVHTHGQIDHKKVSPLAV